MTTIAEHQIDSFYNSLSDADTLAWAKRFNAWRDSNPMIHTTVRNFIIELIRNHGDGVEEFINHINQK